LASSKIITQCYVVRKSNDVGEQRLKPNCQREENLLFFNWEGQMKFHDENNLAKIVCNANKAYSES